MERRRFAGFVFATAAVLSSCGGATGTEGVALPVEATQNDPEKIGKAYISAWMDGDLDRIMNLLSPDTQRKINSDPYLKDRLQKDAEGWKKSDCRFVNIKDTLIRDGSDGTKLVTAVFSDNCKVPTSGEPHFYIINSATVTLRLENNRYFPVPNSPSFRT